jgi:transposase
MKKTIKQIVGIDVAKDELVVCLGRMSDDWTPELFASKNFTNTSKGILSLIEWGTKLMSKDVAVRYVMEATGVYHEHLAYHLDEDGLEVSIVLPNKISNYARTLEVKTVTDKTASEAITLFGLERKLDRWTRPNGLLKKLRQLTRERGQLLDERTVIKNQIHAEKSEAEPSKKAIERMNKRILLVNKQEKDIMDEIEDLLKTDIEMAKLVVLLCSIPGVGLLTAVTILAETNGFELIRNKRQLASFAGLDVREKQSGTSVKGKPKISKRGNRYLRKAMHLPALTAIKHDERFKGIFERLVSKHGIKMKAAVAVQRKVLEMTYTVFKTGKPYEKDYLKTEVKEMENVES